MNIEELREFCLSLDGRVTESMPFGPDHIVFKIHNKMFLLADLEPFESFLAKCDPELALELRGRYPEIAPGYHMNKKHWNTVRVTGDLSDDFLREQVRHSFRQVLAKEKGA